MKINQSDLCRAAEFIYLRLEKTAFFLQKFRINAGIMTFLGLCCAVFGLNFIALNEYLYGLIFLLLNRFCDIMDGIIARQTKITKFGTFADISADYTAAGLLIWGFILARPDNQALEGSFLLLSFFISAISLLAYALISKQDYQALNASKLKICIWGNIQNFDIFLALFLMCLFPDYFIPIAVFFGLLCLGKALLIISSAYYRFEIFEKGSQK